MIHVVRTPVLLVLSLGALTGCKDGTGGGNQKPPVEEVKAQITGSTLTSGAEGVLRGTALDKLSGNLTVDGTTVVPSVRTASEIRFTMPVGRPCEVDGRPVQVQAGALTHAGALDVPSTLSLQVGESRVLTREQLASLCLQLPAGNESYVLTALNPSLTPAAAPDALFTVRTWSASGAAAASLQTSPATLAPVRERRNRAPGPLQGAGAGHSYSDSPVPFDPRYATATVGDTVTWANLDNPNVYCDEPREKIPTFPVIVAAVSTSGKTVLAFDARSPHAAAWMSSENRARVTRAANMMDRWAVPAVQAVMDPGYRQINGGGSRWWHVFRTDVVGFGTDVRVSVPRSMCAYSSEMAATLSTDAPPQSDGQMEYLAAILIHEYAHHAEDVYAVRRWGTTVPPSTASWPIFEAWAQTVQETAARLASNQHTNARYTALGTGIPYPDFYLDGYGEAPAKSPWGGGTGTSRGGYYDQGTRFLMFLRERWGDAAANTTHERFYSRVMALQTRDVPSFARLVGLSATEALDYWSLAEATDNLVDSAAVAAHNLPQIVSWAPQDLGPLSALTLSRHTNAMRALNVGPGNYAALYAVGGGENAGKGLSFTFGAFGSTAFVARITRLN
ncbi:MAG: hypothetical protein AVDCRST_MAG68-4192 [uncultured Gemmatimonadetes bacterium]|uniref:Uncharacterized protein n=1 Tax=uncultured Gemmatimonadota bacterium TaxID=203437 RepID=A0A6J4MEP9_9BACT|nr:MAG: hypothetical protein AVDCRST_MAG68-4192 [uncultured Gemmatimonadota bacterium]